MGSQSEEEMEFRSLIRRTETSRLLNKFIGSYPEIGQTMNSSCVDTTFQDSLRYICDRLLKLEFSYTSKLENSMSTVLKDANQILAYFTNNDIRISLCFMNYKLYLNLATIIERLKNVLLDGDFKSPDLVMDHIFTKTDQHLINTYKSKIQSFIDVGISYEDNLQPLSEMFTEFLIEYIRLLTKSNDYDRLSLESSIELLFEIADNKLLIKKFHRISSLIPFTMKVLILKKITELCLKNSYSLKDNVLLMSDDRNFKVELLILSYHTLQRLCEFLEHQNLNQSFQLLTKISIDSLIHGCVPKVDEENEFMLNTYTNIKTVPSSEIKHCLFMLDELFYSLERYDLNWCGRQFRIVLISTLFEFVMATDLDKLCIESLIEINIGVVYDLPKTFKAASFAIMIYQKLKTDRDLELKAKMLFEKMSLPTMLPSNISIISDLKKLICSGENLIDVCVVTSRFLNDSIMDEDKMVDSLFYEFNECVIVASQDTPINNELIFPFSVALNRSLKTQNNDCLFNNLALLDDYINLVMDKNQIIPVDDRKALINVVFEYYKFIVHYLPENFILKCWDLTISPSGMDFTTLKLLLKERSSTTFAVFIETLKMETRKLVEKKEPSLKNYYTYIARVWNYLLKMHLRNKTKKIRKDLVNHFCFTLNRTFLFCKDKVPTEQGLILLLKIVSSLLQIPWINITTLMNCALRIITFVEKRDISNMEVLCEAAELLIVLYKCPNNSIKPNLGLYIITFANVLKCCCKFAKQTQLTNPDLDPPFQKLAKCSSLFKQNKRDFVFISRSTLETLIEIITVRNSVPEYLMSYCRMIIHNLMDVCSDEELKHLAVNAQGISIDTMSRMYRDHRLHYMFDARY